MVFLCVGYGAHSEMIGYIIYKPRNEAEDQDRDVSNLTRTLLEPYHTLFNELQKKSTYKNVQDRPNMIVRKTQ
jgi:hypothetical protein